MMAKNIRRMLAMFLVLSMFAGAMPLQALATDGTETTPIPGGTMTVTVEGNTTTKEWETTTDNGDGSTTKTEGKETTTTTPVPGGSNTTVEGSETSTTTTPNTTTGSSTGSYESDSTVTDKPNTGGFVGNGSSTDTTSGDGWTQTGTQDAIFTDPETLPEAETVVDGEGKPVQVPGVLEGNYLENEDADLWMDAPTGNQTETTDEDKVQVSETYYKVNILPENLKDVVFDDNGKASTTDENGNSVEIVRELVDGKLTYTVTTRSNPTPEGTTKEELAEADKKDNSKPTGNSYYEYSDSMLDDTYKAVPELTGADIKKEASDIEGYEKVTETVCDANGKVIKVVTRTPVKVTVKDKDGNDVEKIAYDVETRTVTTTPNAEGDKVIDTSDPVDVPDWTELPKELKASDAVELTFESVLNEDGTHKGYKAIDKDGNEVTVDGDEYKAFEETKDGLTTTVTVTKLMKDGKHIGYTTTTQVTDDKGNVMSVSSKSIEQTYYTDASSTTTITGTGVETTDIETVQILGATLHEELEITNEYTHEETLTQNVTKDIYQLVETQDGLFLVFQGKLYKVEGTSNKAESSFAVTDGNVNVEGYMNSTGLDLITGSPSHGNYTGNNLSNNQSGDGTKWNYTGYGMVSNLQAISTNGSDKEKTIRQFELTDKEGNVVYAYCAEMGADIWGGIDYNEAIYNKDNASHDNSQLEAQNGTIAQLRSIATNGFWGTDSGMGSLDAVKELMRRNGIDEKYINMMTPGMAMVATQVAIWEYARNNTNGDKNQVFGNLKKDADGNPLTDTYIDANGNTVVYQTGEREYFHVEAYGQSGSSAISDQEKAIGELRNLLVKLSRNPVEGQAEQITAEKVTGAGVVLKDVVSTDETTGKTTYNTDVKFGLDVSTSSLNGDLVLKVMVDGTAVKTVRLAGSDNYSKLDEAVGKVLGAIQPDANGVFTIPDVELEEGVVFTLNLEGIQHLDDGIYLMTDTGYKGTDWQDFITLSKKDVAVNITMDLEFTVQDDPNFTHKQQTWENEGTYKEIWTKDDTGDRSESGYWKDQSGKTSEKVIGYTTTITTATEIVVEHSEWKEQFQNRLTPPGGGFRMGRNGGNGAAGGNGVTIPDEPVPLAAPPKTGDTTGLWLGMIMLIGMGLYAVNFTKKNRFGSF